MNTHRRLVIAALLGAFLGAGARAQTAAGTGLPAKIYTKRTAFKLPFHIDDKERADVREVKLYVKAGPAEPWTCKETAPPTQNDFTYRVSQDGEYWFSVVTVDRTGKMTPADVTREAPGLIVVVDTQAPDFDLRPLMVSSGEPMLQCKVKDANPDYAKVKLEYHTDKGWQVLEPLADQPGLFRMTDPTARGMVRATVTDKAGNTTTREVNLAGASGTPTAVAANPNPSLPPASGPAMPADYHAELATTESRSEKPAIHTASLTNVPASTAAAAGPAAAASATVTMPSSGVPSLQLINSTHASLEYQIDQVGPSGVGKVEVWMTRDEGMTWQRLCEDGDRQSPAHIQLPGDGLFGLTLVVTNGNGNGGAPPAKGDVPDWWVEVDTTKPAAQLLAVRPGAGDEAKTFLITWTASDKNLKSEPIELFYATQRDGPWMPVARGLKNTGSYRWPIPQGAGPEFYFRMDVTDRAGNCTRCDSAQPVVLDMSHPKARVTGVVASYTQAVPGGGN